MGPTNEGLFRGRKEDSGASGHYINLTHRNATITEVARSLFLPVSCPTEGPSHRANFANLRDYLGGFTTIAVRSTYYSDLLTPLNDNSQAQQ